MNKERYNDPTADMAIAHVMREERIKSKWEERKAVKPDEDKCSNESKLQGSR